MNALAMPISSRTAEERPSACFWANSPRILEERSATDWQTLASSADSVESAGCISHDAISAARALQAPGVVEVMQMGYGLAHGKESLMRIERAAEQQRQELAGAACIVLQLIQQFSEMGLMMRLELRHAGVSAAERLAVRGQHQDVFGQLAVARDRLEKQAQGIALDDAPVGEREFGNQLGVAVAASSHPGGALGIEPVLAEDVEHRFGGVARARGAHRVRGQVFPLRSPELGAEP